MPRFVTEERLAAGHRSQWRMSLTEFYREEFIKHHLCLQQQRSSYSTQAISDAEAALARIMSQLDRLSARANADQVVGQLLKQFDSVTGLSAWSDPKNTH